MAFITRSTANKIEIDLSGPEGNAFHLLGYGRSLAKQLGKDWEPIETKMMSGDYEHLLEVFNDNFGDYVDLIRDKGIDDE